MRLTRSRPHVRQSPCPSLVIVDPLFRLVAIDDGNDYAKVTAALAPLVDLARTTGAHVLTVHHARKTGGDAGDETLGSTGLLGAVDCNLSLKRTSDGERYLSTLQRVGPDMPETLLTMDSETMTIFGRRHQGREIASRRGDSDRRPPARHSAPSYRDGTRQGGEQT